jgi:hypothetical protein
VSRSEKRGRVLAEGGELDFAQHKGLSSNYPETETQQPF